MYICSLDAIEDQLQFQIPKYSHLTVLTLFQNATIGQFRYIQIVVKKKKKKTLCHQIWHFESFAQTCCLALLPNEESNVCHYFLSIVLIQLNFNVLSSPRFSSIFLYFCLFRYFDDDNKFEYIKLLCVIVYTHIESKSIRLLNFPTANMMEIHFEHKCCIWGYSMFFFMFLFFIFYSFDCIWFHSIFLCMFFFVVFERRECVKCVLQWCIHGMWTKNNE